MFATTRYAGLGNVVKIKPPATITQDEADLALEVFEEALREVSQRRPAGV